LVTAPALGPHRQYRQAENKTGKNTPEKVRRDTDDRVTALTTHTGKSQDFCVYAFDTKKF